jgi:hypothetical protein
LFKTLTDLGYSAAHHDNGIFLFCDARPMAQLFAELRHVRMTAHYGGCRHGRGEVPARQSSKTTLSWSFASPTAVEHDHFVFRRCTPMLSGTRRRCVRRPKWWYDARIRAIPGAQGADLRSGPNLEL